MPGEGSICATLLGMGELIGYARVSTDEQDLTAQRDALAALGVAPERIYVDHGLTGTNRARPGLREALAACRAGDTLVVGKLDRLARSLPDARDIAEELTSHGVKLNLGGSVYDPTDPVGRLLFNVLAMVAEFEADLIRANTRGHGRQWADAAGWKRDRGGSVAGLRLAAGHRAAAHRGREPLSVSRWPLTGRRPAGRRPTLWLPAATDAWAEAIRAAGGAPVVNTRTMSR